MQNEIIDLKDFPDFLMRKSQGNFSELAELLDISRGTFYNWKDGTTRKIAPESLNKLASQMGKMNWGFRLGKVKDGKVEIIYEDTDTGYEDMKLASFQNKYYEQQELINKLLKENFELKEALASYKSSKD